MKDNDAIRRCFEVDNLISFQETGSSYTCNPPVMDTDWDYIALVKDIEEAHNYLTTGKRLGVLVFHEWEYTGINYTGMPDDFRTYRNGKYNLIVTEDTSYYLKFCAATEYCKAKNVLKKEDRVMYFTLILQDRPQDKLLTTSGTMDWGKVYYDSTTGTTAIITGPVTGTPTAATFSPAIYPWKSYERL